MTHLTQQLLEYIMGVSYSYYYSYFLKREINPYNFLAELVNYISISEQWYEAGLRSVLWKKKTTKIFEKIFCKLIEEKTSALATCHP